jgi:hypothetical protein
MVTTFEPGRMIWNGYTGRRLDVPPGAGRGSSGCAWCAARSPLPTGPAAPAELGPARVLRMST